jgi:hypothetical protein
MDGGPEPREPDRLGRSRTGAIAPVAVAGGQPPIWRWIALVVIAVALAIAKPWAALEPPAGSGHARVVAATPSPTPSLTPAPTPRQDTAGPLVAAFCTDPTRWLVASTEHWQGQAVRVWRALDPAPSADGPDDPTIPIVPVVSEALDLLGWCAPVVGPDRPVDQAFVEVWLRTPGRAATQLALAQALPPGEPSAFGLLYAAPGAAGGGAVRSGGPGAARSPVPSAPAAVWAAGQYVFHY